MICVVPSSDGPSFNLKVDYQPCTEHLEKGSQMQDHMEWSTWGCWLLKGDLSEEIYPSKHKEKTISLHSFPSFHFPLHCGNQDVILNRTYFECPPLYQEANQKPGNQVFRCKLRRSSDLLFRETQFTTPRRASILYLEEAQVALLKAFWKACSMLILLKGIIKRLMDVYQNSSLPQRRGNTRHSNSSNPE